MKLCQGPKCHEYKTKDRIRGSKGDKHYQTRKASRFYYMNGNCCTFQCQSDWFSKFGEMALNRFGRTTEPKRQDASGAWYKDYRWNRTETTGQSRYNHFFVNDLLGQRIPITEQQYQDENLTTPSTTR